MVCAFIPLFTMSGPEGQIFGPMAHTYAFALGGALLLALTLAPVMCLLFFKHLKPAPDNFLVAWLKNSYLRSWTACLRHRWIALALFTRLIGFTAIYAVPQLGHEFMPELEEGNLWVRGRFPLNVSLDRVTRERRRGAAHPVLLPRGGDGRRADRPARTTAPTWPASTTSSCSCRSCRRRTGPGTVEQTGWRRWLHGDKRARTKEELIEEMNAELSAKLPGADFNFSQNIRDNVMESLSGVKGDNSVKIFGPDLEKLDDLAEKMRDRLQKVPGIENVGVFSIKGQTNMEFRVDLEKCRKWGVSANDVNTVIQTALGGKAVLDHDRGREAVRHHRALAEVAARQRDDDPRHPSGHRQQPAGPGLRAGLEPQPARLRQVDPADEGRQPWWTRATRSRTRRGGRCATS